MFAPAFTSGLVRDAVPAGSVKVACRLRAPRGDVAAAALLLLPLAAAVLILRRCVSEEQT